MASCGRPQWKFEQSFTIHNKANYLEKTCISSEVIGNFYFYWYLNLFVFFFIYDLIVRKIGHCTCIKA